MSDLIGECSTAYDVRVTEMSIYGELGDGRKSVGRRERDLDYGVCGVEEGVIGPGGRCSSGCSSGLNNQKPLLTHVGVNQSEG